MSATELALDVLKSFHHNTSAEPRSVFGTTPDLRDVLERRAAVRRYAATPVSAEDLFDSVRDGLADHDLEPVILAMNVTGLDPGMYTLDGERVAALDDPGRLVLQAEFATAAAIVAVLGDVQGAVARHGGHGYRLLMTSAGAAVYGMWLAAISRGMCGSVFAGLLPAAIRIPLRCDGVTRHQLFAVALGAE